MSKIIPINITTTEQAVELDATYQFAWLRNMGENDCLLSGHSGIVAGGDDVMTVKAGESGRISTSDRAVYVKAVSGTSTGEIHAQNFSDAPFKSKAKGGGQSISVEPLTVNENGVYTAPTGKAYSPVSVDVQEQPWQPLQDGYSNFWFELTNDTLSPWLNFSAKTESAVIDWGDGSGEQALTTLTPTHTYSKAGKYVVKVKGVNGIARVIADEQLVSSYPYLDCLKYIELNNEVTTLSAYVFANLLGLKELYITNNSIISAGAYVFSIAPLLEKSNLNVLGTYAYRYCTKLRDINLGNATTIPTYGFDNCINLLSITIPATVTEIGNQVFRYCFMIKDIHIQATTPPTIGTNVFLSANNYYTIYVPVGTLSAYQTAWSEYADHILEEGQTPNRMMLAKFNSAKTDEP